MQSSAVFYFLGHHQRLFLTNQAAILHDNDIIDVDDSRPCLLRCASAIAHHQTPKMALSVIFSTPESGNIIHN